MRGEQNNILFPVRISWAYHFPNLSPFAPPLGLCSSATPRLNLRRKIILNLKNHAINIYSCTILHGIKLGAVFHIAFVVVVRFCLCCCWPLNAPF